MPAARALARRVAGRLRREAHARTTPGEGDAVVEAGGKLPFDTWERAGWHLTRADFLSPIPIVAELSESLWTTASELPGIDMRGDAQIAMLRDFATRFAAEYDALPRTSPDGTYRRFFLDNMAFGPVDAEIYYAMLRSQRPERVVEIGSGWSTLLSLEALRRNVAEGRPGRVIVIDPYPHEFLRDAVAANADIVELWDRPLQDVPVSFFEQLDAGDFLFIDSSHVLKVGSDVQYMYLEILPRAPVGLVVHVHDVFLPSEYPRDWVVNEHRFWNEQYLLQAYLIHNTHVEVLWGGAWMFVRHPDELANAIASCRDTERSGGGGSFWFRIR